jgi:DNA-binding Lrp family transcriptional regulator
MVVSYILINTKPAMEHQVYDELRLNENVIEVHPLFGDYDLLVKIDVDNFDKLGKIILENIRQIKGVEDTKTLTGIKI